MIWSRDNHVVSNTLALFRGHPSHFILVTVRVLIVMMVVHVREVWVYQAVLLNLAQLRMKSWMQTNMWMLILHSFILTLITRVIFFEFVIIVRLGVLDGHAVFLPLPSDLLLLVAV